MIDARIPLGINAPQIQMPDPNAGMNSLARMVQISGAMDEQKVNALKMDEYRRGVEEMNSLRRVMTPDFSWDDPAKRGAAISAAPLKAQELYGKHLETQSKVGENKKRAFDMAKESYGLFQKTLSAHAANPQATKQGVLTDVGRLVAAGMMDEGVATRLVQNMPEEPQQLSAFLRTALTSQMEAKDVLTAFAPKPEKVDNGQQIGFRDTNPNSPTYGQSTAGAAVQKVADPNAVLTANTSTANNQRSVSAQLANAQATRDAAATTAQGVRDAANIQTGYQNEQGLRKEFEALPEVKKYKNSLPAFKGIQDAVTRNTTQSDINIVYGLAKIYDPESVVREGEYATVANSPNIPERIKGYAQYLAGGGRLTPQVKAEILAEAQSRMRSFEEQYGGARKDFESIAKRSGVDPSRVFPSTPAPAVAAPAAAVGGLPQGWSVKKGQ